MVSPQKLKDMRTILSSEPITKFHVSSLAFQSFAEIDPVFYRRQCTNFRNIWFVLDGAGPSLKLKINGKPGFPLIIDGWSDLKQRHGLPNNVEVVFAFFGHSVFGILGFKEIASPTQLLPFHSRSEVPFQTIKFDVMFTNLITKHGVMVVSKKFIEYIKDFPYPSIHMCTDNGSVDSITVSIMKGSYNTLLLENGWTELCERNGFALGDTVHFKFSSDCRCHVYKIGNH